jgi:hypothetical protein
MRGSASAQNSSSSVADHPTQPSFLSLPDTMNEYPLLPDDPRAASRRSDLGAALSATQSQSESDDDDDEGLNGSSKKRKRDNHRGVMNVT